MKTSYVVGIVMTVKLQALKNSRENHRCKIRCNNAITGKIADNGTSEKTGLQTCVAVVPSDATEKENLF